MGEKKNLRRSGSNPSGGISVLSAEPSSHSCCMKHGMLLSVVGSLAGIFSAVRLKNNTFI